MGLIRSILGRRQFLIAFSSSAVALVFGRISSAVEFIFKAGRVKASEQTKIADKKSLKGIVIYYSATGSTRKAAEAIHQGMKAVIECDIAPVKDVDPKEMGKYDVVAIGGPIWYNRETANLTLFIYDMPHMAGKLCVSFCTHGRGPNGFFFSISKPLLKKGFTLIGWDDWYGSCFHVLHMPKPYYTDGHPDKIDLMEAEAFGRDMAERAQKIYAGERDLIPEIPFGPDADSLWKPLLMERNDYSRGDSAGGVPGAGAPGGGPGSGGAGPGRAAGPVEMGGMGMGYNPKIDLNKCIYPKCEACMHLCVQGAIDLFAMTAPAVRISGSEMLVKEACVQCNYPMCQRACSYDAIIYESRTTKHEIDMNKCTYPKCTLCLDECPMNSIYLSSENKLVYHNNCEGGDLCYCICPTGAITIPNIGDTVHAGAGSRPSQGAGGVPGGGMPELGRAPEGGGGMDGELAQAEATGRFRWVVPRDEVGKAYSAVLNVKNRPIMVLQEDDWPIMKDSSGNIIRNHYD